MIKHLEHQRHRIYKLVQEGSWIFIGQAATVLGSLMLVRVLTEYLSPVEYGELALGLTIAGLVNQVVMGGVAASIARFYSIALERGDLSGYFRASSLLFGYATLAVFVIAILISSALLISGQHHWLELAIVILVFSILSSFNSAINSVQNAARQRSIVAIHNGIDAWLKIGFAVAFILWLGTENTSVVLGYVISAIIITISQLFFLKRLIIKQGILHSDNGSNENWNRQMWLFSWPFSAWGLFTWAQQVSDRWALETFATTQEVGLYAVIFQLGYVPITIITGLGVTLIAPILYQRTGDATDYSKNFATHNLAWQIAKLSLISTIIAFTFTWFLHEWLFSWLVADAFRSVSHHLPWIVLAGGIFATGQVLGLKLMAEKRHQTMIPAKIYTAIFGIVINILGAWAYGMNGVITALVLFSTIYFLSIFRLAYTAPLTTANVYLDKG